MSYLTQTPATQQDFDALEQRIANLERRGQSHSATHEVGGSDVARLHVRNAGTALGKQRSLNFGAGLTATEDQTNKEIDVVTALTLDAGTYTPTLTNVANVAASTAYQAQYLRVGATVVVSGRFDADPTTANVLCQLAISLPITSNIGASEDCAGVANSEAGLSIHAEISGDSVNNRAEARWTPEDAVNRGLFFIFAYQLI